MTITICHNKPPDRKWDWNVDDIMPRRDGPENLRILKRRQLGTRTLKEELGFLPLRGFVVTCRSYVDSGSCYCC